MLDFNKIIFEQYKCFKTENVIENIKPIIVKIKTRKKYITPLILPIPTNATGTIVPNTNKKTIQ